MTREKIIKYIEFRASGINQAINYDYKEFYKEMLEMCKQEKQVKQNDLLHSVMRCSVKDIDKFYEETGYSDNTNDWGIRKDKRNEWDWKNPSQMIKDWMKWKRNNA